MLLFPTLTDLCWHVRVFTIRLITAQLCVLVRRVLLKTMIKKRTALQAMIDRFFPGRTKELRPIKIQELKATSVIAMEIESAAAKCRAEGVSDDDEDFSARVWEGVIQLEMRICTLQPDPRLHPEIKMDKTLLESFKPDKCLDDCLLQTQWLYENQNNKSG